MTLRRGLALLTVCLSASLATGGSAAAQTNVAVGLGDQSAAMFASPAYQALGMRKTRFFIGWDAFLKNDLARADAFVAAANASGVKVLLHISDSDFGRNQGKLPSVREYRREVGKIVRRYRRLGVRTFGVWNEANHDSQSTYRNPRRAAQFFGQMRQICKGCTIVALDVLDQRGVEGYIRKWYAAIPRSQRRFARVVGIHNYSDTNRYRSRGTAAIIKEVKRRDTVKTKLWLTETGGIVQFGSNAFACDPANPIAAERRAAKAVRYMFSLARKFRRDITRLYAYNFFGTNCTTRFDAGIVRLDGSPRASYTAFKDGLADFKR